MSLMAALQARRSRVRPNAELEQAIVRIVLVGLVTLYVCWLVSVRAPPMLAHDRVLLTGVAGWLILAISILAATWVWPAANIPRRVLGMLADAGAITFGLFLAGESGAILVGFYLLIIFGNGFRYGRKYLFLCQALCLASFGLVMIGSSWWQDEPYVGFGLIVWMIVLPFYVSALVARIDAARVRAEEALKECVERERRGS